MGKWKHILYILFKKSAKVVSLRHTSVAFSLIFLSPVQCDTGSLNVQLYQNQHLPRERGQSQTFAFRCSIIDVGCRPLDDASWCLRILLLFLPWSTSSSGHMTHTWGTNKNKIIAVNTKVWSLVWSCSLRLLAWWDGPYFHDGIEGRFERISEGKFIWSMKLAFLARFLPNTEGVGSLIFFLPWPRSLPCTYARASLLPPFFLRVTFGGKTLEFN